MKCKIICRFFPLLLVLVVTGCSTVEPGKHYSSTPLNSLKTAFVVYSPGGDRVIGAYICTALAEHGVTATAGDLEERPKDVDFYVTYCEVKKLDLNITYLDSLDIQFRDSASEQPIASGSFRNSALHTYPDMREKTFQVMDSIYDAK